MSKKSIIQLLLLEILAVLLFVFSFKVYFLAIFDALDNYWLYTRYFIFIYPRYFLYICLVLFTLLLSIILKNNLKQKQGRSLMIFITYLIRGVFVCSVLQLISELHVFTSVQNFDAVIPFWPIITLLDLVLMVVVFFVLIKEVLFKYKLKLN